MPDALASFHFLRPWWLLAIPVVAGIWWLVRRHSNGGAILREGIAPHLRDALTVGRRGGGRIVPVDLLAVAMACGALAAAGPAWSRLPSPWFSETAPLVVAIEVSDSMRSNDTQPTRLDRARFKILDLIEGRTGARTALISYAGSAHIVMPPTEDAKILAPFLEGLDPSIMPSQGANAGAVLPLARQLLGDESVGGTLLFVNDGFERADLPALAEFAKAEAAPAMAALVLGTERGGVPLLPDGSIATSRGGGRLDTRIDLGALRRFESETGASLVRATVDDADVRRLMRRIESRLQQAAEDDPNVQWKDEGWWLVWPAAILTAAWFRRGWTMQW